MKTKCPKCGADINAGALLQAQSKKRPRQFFVDMVNARKDRKNKPTVK